MSGSTNTSKTNSISKNNSEVPEDCSMFKYYMEKCYVLPSELKNDIIYCQRALRDFLKVHGLVSDVFKDQGDADPVQMQRILDELESEVAEINAEQQYLMLRLDEDLDLFYKKLEENNIQTVPEMGNEYVSSLIVPLISDPNYHILPQSVQVRDTEELLIKKHFLLQDEETGDEHLKLSEMDDNVPQTENEIVPGALTLISDENENDDVEMKPLTPLELELPSGSLPTLSMSTPPLTPSSAITVRKDPQRSLLIPRGSLSSEGETSTILSQPPPLTSAKQQRSPRSDVKQPLKRMATSPPPLAPIAKVAASASASVSASASGASAQDMEVVAQSRMNLRQALRRARKTKQQPRKFDDEDALELPSDKATQDQSPPQLNSVATKAKPQATVAANPTPANANAKKPPQQAHKTRNTYGAGRKPETVKSETPPPPSVAVVASASGSSGSSDDLHQELELELKRLCASAAQWRDEPRETRVLPSEYGQDQFLGLFGLYTHDMIKKFCQRHSKRKRRTVQNASGVDFHYGQQLAAIDAVRQKKLKDKPEFLLSPKDKRLQAKKAHKAAAAAASANRKSKSQTPEKLDDPPGCNHTELGKQRCKECRKRTTEMNEDEMGMEEEHMMKKKKKEKHSKKGKKRWKEGKKKRSKKEKKDSKKEKGPYKYFGYDSSWFPAIVISTYWNGVVSNEKNEWEMDQKKKEKEKEEPMIEEEQVEHGKHAKKEKEPCEMLYDLSNWLDREGGQRRRRRRSA